MTAPVANVVLAALDPSAAARPVLDTALSVARITGGRVEAIHVSDRESETLKTLTERAVVPLRRVAGLVEPTVLTAMAAPDVVIAVIGARSTPSGRRPVGRTARRLLEQATKPVVVVPPDASAARTFTRLLMPLEGEAVSSRPVLDAFLPLLVGDVELFVLHVFTQATLPRMLDKPHYDLEILGREFIATHLPGASRIEMCTGPVGTRVAEMTEQHHIDLIVLTWSQDSSEGRAQVVQDVLARSPIPVMLLPVPSQPSTAADAVGAQ